MSIEEKDGRSLANAGSLVENENQNHQYNANETPDTAQATFEGKGENAEREVKTNSSVTGGRHITGGKDGLEVAKQREAHVRRNRAESEKAFDRKRR
jgi:hypothetical protein